MDDLPNVQSIQDIMHGGRYLEWPQSFRHWMQISKQIFSLHPEKYIFPGWYLELWKKWGYPNPSSTLSGLILP